MGAGLSLAAVDIGSEIATQSEYGLYLNDHGRSGAASPSPGVTPSYHLVWRGQGVLNELWQVDSPCSGWPVVLTWAVCISLAQAAEPGVSPPEGLMAAETMATTGGNSLGQSPLRVAEGPQHRRAIRFPAAQRAPSDPLPPLGQERHRGNRKDPGLFGHAGQAGADRRETGRIPVHVRQDSPPPL